MGGQIPALGSCATTPVKSPDAFTGVVAATRYQGRAATVRTDSGTTVEILGTLAGERGATSVDRTYEVGGRYEFHPTNDSSPFLDNACTATRLLSMTAVPSMARDDSPAVTNTRSVVVVVATSVLVLAGFVAAFIRRRT